MGGFWSFSRPRNEASSSREAQTIVGFFDCSPGCRASESDVRYCSCRCQGINHGALVQGRGIRPIQVPVPNGPGSVNSSVFLEPEPILQIAPQMALPNIQQSQPSPSTSRQALGTSKPEYERVGKILGRKIGKSFKHAFAGYSQTELNESIWKGLRSQFNEERVNAIVDQAYTFRMLNDPYQNQPELYEMFETGDIDRALEHFNIRWVIGRPKRKRSK